MSTRTNSNLLTGTTLSSLYTSFSCYKTMTIFRKMYTKDPLFWGPFKPHHVPLKIRLLFSIKFSLVCWYDSDFQNNVVNKHIEKFVGKAFKKFAACCSPRLTHSTVPLCNKPSKEPLLVYSTSHQSCDFKRTLTELILGREVKIILFSSLSAG